jgi:phosphoribosylanthranilate isomerase
VGYLLNVIGYLIKAWSLEQGAKRENARRFVIYQLLVIAGGFKLCRRRAPKGQRIMYVKICGIRRQEDALIAAELGADAIGLLVGQRHNSPDFVSATVVRNIARALPPSVEAVLVTHVEDADELERLLQESEITTVQLHSEIAPSSVEYLRGRLPNLKIFKSINIISADSVAYPEAFEQLVDGFVLDSINVATNQVGGTGKTHDWSVSRQIVMRYSEIPIILAGGLNSENVRSAIECVRPFGVDVNSGTKASDGFKDPRKMEAFIVQAKRFAKPQT